MSALAPFTMEHDPGDRFARRAAVASRVEARYQADPVVWMVEAMGVPERTVRWSGSPGYATHGWDGTVDPFVVVARALAESKSAAIEAGTGTNKTFNAALLGLWFLEQFVEATVVTTAPKEDQLTLHLWKEVSKLWPAFSRRNPGAVLDKLRIRMRAGSDLWAMHGFVAGVAADEVEQSATKAQGFHAEHLLVIHEEMPGTASAILRAFENTCTAPHNLRVGQGNPDHQADPLHVFAGSHGVVAVRVSAYDHPNVVCGDPSIVPGAVSRASIDRRIANAPDGPDDRMVLSRVRGIAPSEASDALIRWEWCEAAARADRPVLAEVMALPGAKGVDVAQSESGDKAAIATFRGPYVVQVREFGCPNATQLGRDVVRECEVESIPMTAVGVDGIGVGAATVNAIAEVPAGWGVVNIQSAGRPVRRRMKGAGADWAQDVNRFANLRSQMWWQLREDLQHGRVGLPNDPVLFRELTTPRYGEPGNKVLVEPKEAIRKRLGGGSPNRAEAVVYGNWVRPRTLEAEAPALGDDQDRHPGFDRYGKRKRRGASEAVGFQMPEPRVPGLDDEAYGPVWEAA